MNLRSIAVWCLFVVLAIMNGALRTTLLTPWLGELRSHITSTVMLCVAILLVTWLTIGWLRPSNLREALFTGGAWALMTAAFEFLAGHYVFGSPWTTLFADYDLFAGRVWILVLVTTAFAPFLVARLHEGFTLPQ